MSKSWSNLDILVNIIGMTSSPYKGIRSLEY